MNVLVTGGSGKVGRYVVESLMDEHTVTVLDLREPAGPHHRFHRADVLSLSALSRIMDGFDAVVHLAGIPHPLDEPGEKVFQVNTIGTFNALEASAAAGVGTFVFMSSESTLGFAFARNRMAPLYAPIDERHALRPQDPYGMSKVSGELLCAGYSRTYGMRTIALRAPWIWVPEKEDVSFYRTLVAEYEKWSQNLWAFIHVRDVCQAVLAALKPGTPGMHDVCFIAAAEQWTDLPTTELLRRFYPDTPVADGFPQGRASLISTARAAELLGFRPAYSRDDVLR